jgi:hypothetical protein
VLKVPAVHLVELVQVQVLARHDAHGDDAGDARSEQDHVADFHLAGEAADKTTLKLVVIALRFPRPRIARPDKPNAVSEEHVGIRPG